MISYPDFEFAIARWKSRAAGVPQPATPMASGTVAAEVPVATAPEAPEAIDDGYVSSELSNHASGSIVVSDSSIEPPNPESE
ncbi:MAG TPA: hypothetical protein VIM14_19040 [Polyangia bacterium]